MQSTLYYTPSNSLNFLSLCKSPIYPTSTKILTSTSLRTRTQVTFDRTQVTTYELEGRINDGFESSKPVQLEEEINDQTQVSYELEGRINDDFESSKPVQLPIVIRRYGKVSRYFWDGIIVRLLSIDDGGGGSGGAPIFFNLDKVVEVFGLAVRNFFIPKQVSENYMGYVKWKFLHRVFSSALQVLATQAMFRAIGIGYSRSLPSAAALNWVLKDGLGRLSRCIYTASLASAFDTNLKRVRFTTSLLFTLSVGVELLTPVFPQHFLLLASLANIAKQMSLACYVATNSAIHQSFAIADNLAEVSAKSQIQSVCFDNLGLMLAAGLNILLKNNESILFLQSQFDAIDMADASKAFVNVDLVLTCLKYFRLQAGLPFIVYPFFSAIDLFGIYQGLKHVHLQTLTKDRLEIILDTWIGMGYVPSPEEVSKEEDINFMWGKGQEPWRIRIGCLDPKGQLPKLSMIAMQSVGNNDCYFLCMEIFYKGLARTREQGILLCLREGAHTADVIMGLLQACYVRKVLHSSRWASIMKASDSSDLILKEWFKLIEDNKSYAQREIGPLNKRMAAMGWATKNILLNTKEQARYSYMDDE